MILIDKDLIFQVASFYSLGAGGTFWYAHVSPGDHRYSFLQDRVSIKKMFGLGAVLTAPLLFEQVIKIK